MSQNGIGNGRRLAPRALRIRNRCLTNLAARHALPLPGERDIAAFDDTVGLEDSWQQWGGHMRPQRARRSRRELSAATSRPCLSESCGHGPPDGVQRRVCFIQVL